MALVGSGLHLLIAFLKRKQPQGSPLEGLLWVHIRWLHFARGIVGVGFVVFVYYLFNGKPKDLLTAILLGYSADSFIDAIIDRFEKVVEPAVDPIRDKLTQGTS